LGYDDSIHYGLTSFGGGYTWLLLLTGGYYSHSLLFASFFLLERTLNLG